MPYDELLEEEYEPGSRSGSGSGSGAEIDTDIVYEDSSEILNPDDEDSGVSFSKPSGDLTVDIEEEEAFEVRAPEAPIFKLVPKDSADPQSDEFKFNLNPDKFSVKQGTKTQSLTVIKRGEIKYPRGRKTIKYSWSGDFPTESETAALGVFYKDPIIACERLKKWMEEGTTLKFTVTELSIYDEVFIESFDYKVKGANCYSYSIDLYERRPIYISVKDPVLTGDDTEKARDFITDFEYSIGKTTKENRKVYNTWAKHKDEKKHEIKSVVIRKIPVKGTLLLLVDHKKYRYRFLELSDWSRDSILQALRTWESQPEEWIGRRCIKVTTNTLKADTTRVTLQTAYNARVLDTYAGETYLVKTGDTLYGIAKMLCNDGTKYTELYDLNKAVIDKLNEGTMFSKYTIWIGTLLKIPASWRR